MQSRRWLTALSLVLVAGVSLAQGIPNWPTPSSWTPPADELSKLVLSPPLPFAPITPCRVVDTRPSQGFTGAYGPPIMAANATRDFNIALAPHCPDIPDTAAAFSLNITVTETVGPGDVRVWPTGNPPLIVSTQNWPAAGMTLANAAIVPGGNGSITVQIAGSNTHLIIDINGVFYGDLIPTQQFLITSNIAGAGAIVGVNNSNASGSTGTFGFAGGSGPVYGLRGQISNAAGASSAAVQGLALVAPSPNQVFGGHFLTNGTVTNTAGVFADSDATTGKVFGLIADNDSSTPGSAGVWGRIGSNTFSPAFTVPTIGVLGSSINSGAAENIGVAGIVEGLNSFGVYGARSGVTASAGCLGCDDGVKSFGNITAVGSIFAGGTKFFVEPHPTDAALEIAYVSLEGNEVGTYFRGKGKFQDGIARISVPEDFRLVSESDGLSIQVTPIGEMASFAVVRIDLNEIVVKASRNVEFFYTVNGVRKRYGDFKPFRKNEHFVPQSKFDRMRDWPSWVRERLIQNGTLTPEGTPNLETAERLGWKATWEKEAVEAKKHAAANREEERAANVLKQ